MFQPVTVPTVFAKRSPRFAQRLRSGAYRETPEGLEKRCCKCREYWPADNTAFYTAPSNPDGLYDWCKACYWEWRRKWEAGRKRNGQVRVA